MASTSAAPAGTQGNSSNVGSQKLMWLMIEQGLISELGNLIRTEKYNPRALWTLDKVLYNNETGEARETAVRKARENLLIEMLLDIVCRRYNNRSFLFTDRASSENVNAAIRCLRTMVLNDEGSRKKMVEMWPNMQDILTSMSQIEIEGTNQIRNAIYQDIKDVARHILREVPEWNRNMEYELRELLQRIKENMTNVNKSRARRMVMFGLDAEERSQHMEQELHEPVQRLLYEFGALEKILDDGKPDKVRKEVVAIAREAGAVEILLRTLQAAAYLPTEPYRYRYPQPSENVHAAIRCLRTMVLNDEGSRKKMMEWPNMQDILTTMSEIEIAARHILREVPEWGMVPSAEEIMKDMRQQLPQLVQRIRIKKNTTNVNGLRTLKKILYDHEKYKVRKEAVVIAREVGAVEILLRILEAPYPPTQPSEYPNLHLYANVNAAIHCLHIMVLNDELSGRKMVEWPHMRDILTSMSEIQITHYYDTKDVARSILEATVEWKSAEDIIKDMEKELTGLVQWIRRNRTNVNGLQTLYKVLYDSEAEKARRNAVAIAREAGVVEILIENLQAGYFPDIPYKYKLEGFTMPTIQCLRIMVANDRSSWNKTLKLESIGDILESVVAHPKAEDRMKHEAAHILLEEPELRKRVQPG